MQTRLKLKDGSWGMVVGIQLTKRKYCQPDANGQNVGLLNYAYYAGQWSALPDFTKLTPSRRGQVKSLDLKIASANKDYGLVFDGVLNVETKGIYTFCLASDDGSRLTIGGSTLVNDGIHGPKPDVNLTLPLEVGKYHTHLEYFQNAGGQALRLDWQAPGISRRPVF